MTTVAGTSKWTGSFFDGTGTMSTDTSETIHDAPYTFGSRFEGAPGAIPEELLVTGHAGCYNHALANIARKNGVTVESITTTAQLTMGTDNQGSDGHGYSVEGIHLIVRADLPSASNEQFQLLADEAHGSALDRVGAFQEGFDGDAATCAAIDHHDIERRHVGLPPALQNYSSPEAEAGEMPITDDSLGLLRETLTAIFKPDKEPTLTVGATTGCADATPSPPASYCPATNTINVDLAGLQRIGAYADSHSRELLQGDDTASPSSRRGTCSRFNINKASR